MLNPLRKKKNEGNDKAGKRTTLVITACMSRSWKVEVCQKKKNTTGRRDDQSAISSKEHVMYETTQTHLSVTYQHDRLHLTGKRLQQRSQGPQQQQSTPPSKESSRGEKTPKAYDAIRDECMPLSGFSSVDTVDFYYDLRVAQLNRRNDYLSLCFFCRKCMVQPRSMP